MRWVLAPAIGWPAKWMLPERGDSSPLIVEQDVQAALERATRGYVLETGHAVLEGTAEHLLGDERVRQAYLGV